MEIEELNKSQIVMLTLLVSFVTSIATGIVTVSLMQQAPPAITQTVNRVIEHTVEKIVPGQAATAAIPSPITQTVVVKEGQTLATAVDTASPSVVRVYTSASTDPQFLGLGIVVDTSGTVVIDTAEIGEGADAVLDVGSGARVRAFVTKRMNDIGLAYLSPATTTTADAPVPAWKPVSLPGQQTVLGATVVSLSGRTATKLGQGIMTGSADLSGVEGVRLIETNVPDASVIPGSPLIDAEGALIGISTGVSRKDAGTSFVSSSVLVMKDSAPDQQ